MELIKSEEKGDIFTVQVKAKANWISKLFGGKDKIDEVVFNKRNGDMSQNGLIRKGSFDIAMHEYYKKYGTYGAVGNLVENISS